jgi:hypothetical protein
MFFLFNFFVVHEGSKSALNPVVYIYLFTHLGFFLNMAIATALQSNPNQRGLVFVDGGI